MDNFPEKESATLITVLHAMDRIAYYDWKIHKNQESDMRLAS